MSLNYTTAKSEKDLNGILELQKKNLSTILTNDEKESQGFVTVNHSLNDLKKMNDIEQHVICKDHDKVVAYALAMTAMSKNDIPVLIPMFDLFDSLTYKGRPISTYNYIVVGQVCVDKQYRGQGVFDSNYVTYKNQFKDKYDFAITEIAVNNTRSINAHKRIGFSEIHRDAEWSIVIWPW
jgi:hypothetical protein